MAKEFAAIVTVVILLMGINSFSAETSSSSTELDAFWAEMSRCVNEGDFDNLAAAYHADAVLVNGFKSASYPVSKAFDEWKRAELLQFRFDARGLTWSLHVPDGEGDWLRYAPVLSSANLEDLLEAADGAPSAILWGAWEDGV